MGRKDAELVITELKEDLILYQFTDKQARLGDTIVVIKDENQKALLIDTAFPEYSQRVKEDLQGRGVTVTTLVLSHYHSDHVSGCPVFGDCEIYAGEQYERNYNNCKVWEPGYTYVVPNRLVKDGDRLVFGTYDLEFLLAPGHSLCSLITRVTPEIIHVGDLIMNTWDGLAALPFITDGGDFMQHMESLEKIKQLNPGIMLLPHGGAIQGRENIHGMVEKRLYYLEKTSGSMGTLPLPACLMDDIANYDHLEFHDTNLEQLL